MSFPVDHPIRIMMTFIIKAANNTLIQILLHASRNIDKILAFGFCANSFVPYSSFDFSTSRSFKPFKERISFCFSFLKLYLFSVILIKRGTGNRPSLLSMRNTLPNRSGLPVFLLRSLCNPTHCHFGPV